MRQLSGGVSNVKWLQNQLNISSIVTLDLLGWLYNIQNDEKKRFGHIERKDVQKFAKVQASKM